jgi:hypothetical protein
MFAFLNTSVLPFVGYLVSLAYLVLTEITLSLNNQVPFRKIEF